MEPERPPVEQLVLEFGDLRIRVERAEGASQSSGYQAPSGSTGPLLQGALARPDRAPGQEAAAASAPESEAESWVRVPQDSSEPAPWSEEWERALLAAQSAEELLQVDLSPVDHLLTRVRSSSNGFSPLARLGRALRAGVQAREKLRYGRCSAGSTPALTLPSKIYVILEPAPGGSPGWTDDYLLFRDQVRGKHGDLHGDSVCHAFPSRAEAEAYLLGARRPWPALLRRR